MNRQINLNARNFKIIPYNQEKYKSDMLRYFCGSYVVHKISLRVSFSKSDSRGKWLYILNWPTVETHQFLIVLTLQLICLHSQILSHPMLGNLINIMQVKLTITINNIWRHYGVYTFSQNLHYAIRCIVWRKQNHAVVFWKIGEQNATIMFFLKCVLFARPLMT